MLFNLFQGLEHSFCIAIHVLVRFRRYRPRPRHHDHYHNDHHAYMNHYHRIKLQKVHHKPCPHGRFASRITWVETAVKSSLIVYWNIKHILYIPNDLYDTVLLVLYGYSKRWKTCIEICDLLVRYCVTEHQTAHAVQERWYHLEIMSAALVWQNHERCAGTSDKLWYQRQHLCKQTPQIWSMIRSKLQGTSDV